MAAKAFALPLGYLLIILGVAVLLGIKQRVTLFVTGLLYVGLAFGLMSVGSIEGEGIAWLGMHVLMFAVALVLARHNRFALCGDKSE